MTDERIGRCRQLGIACPCCEAAADRQFARMDALDAQLGGQSIDEIIAERDKLRALLGRLLHEEKFDS